MMEFNEIVDDGPATRNDIVNDADVKINQSEFRILIKFIPQDWLPQHLLHEPICLGYYHCDSDNVWGDYPVGTL